MSIAVRCVGGGLTVAGCPALPCLWPGQWWRKMTSSHSPVPQLSSPLPLRSHDIPCDHMINMHNTHYIMLVATYVHVHVSCIKLIGLWLWRLYSSWTRTSYSIYMYVHVHVYMYIHDCDRVYKQHVHVHVHVPPAVVVIHTPYYMHMYMYTHTYISYLLRWWRCWIGQSVQWPGRRKPLQTLPYLHQ